MTVTMPPEVVRTRASSTVLVKASSFVKRDLAGIVDKVVVEPRLEVGDLQYSKPVGGWRGIG